MEFLATAGQRRSTLCDYVVSSSSDTESDTDLGNKNFSIKSSDEKPVKPKETISDDFLDIRDELLDHALEKVGSREPKRVSKDKEDAKKQTTPDRARRSRSRSRDRRRKEDRRSRDRSDERRHDDDRRHNDTKRKPYNDDRRRERERDYDDDRDYHRRKHYSPNRDHYRQRRPRAPPPPKTFEQIANKKKEEIERRKLLWKGPEEKKVANHWEAMLASCTDEKQAEKLKKLIGLKHQNAELTDASDEACTSGNVAENKTKVAVEETRLKQEHLFRNLDQQYEMARASTHTHRGMGLGFTSQMNEYMAHIQHPQVATQNAPQSSALQR